MLDMPQPTKDEEKWDSVKKYKITKMLNDLVKNIRSWNRISYCIYST